MAYTQPETVVFEALCTQYKALAPSYPIAWPNVRAPAVPTTGYYAEVFNLKNTTRRVRLRNASVSQFMGIFQITLSTPLMTGESDLLEEAGKIAAGFESAATLKVTGGHVRIDGRPSIVTMKSANGARWLAPISVNWRATL